MAFASASQQTIGLATADDPGAGCTGKPVNPLSIP